MQATLTMSEATAKRTTRLVGRRWLLVGGVLVVAVCGFANAEQAVMTSLLKPLDLVSYRSGTMPPHFSGRTIDARQISMTDLRGRVVLVNFWASWCLECRPDMPALERLHREFTPRGLSVISVNAREETSAVDRYARELGLTFPLVLDPDGKINRLYGVIGLPTTFIVARDGRAVAFAIGPREWGSAPARALFNALLAEPVPRSPAQ
jgi:cytochrome c biogenesis protein CcmG, thiol:disulfide interchange protein DsbE